MKYVTAVASAVLLAAQPLSSYGADKAQGGQSRAVAKSSEGGLLNQNSGEKAPSTGPSTPLTAPATPALIVEPPIVVAQPPVLGPASRASVLPLENDKQTGGVGLFQIGSGLLALLALLLSGVAIWVATSQRRLVSALETRLARSRKENDAALDGLHREFDASLKMVDKNIVELRRTVAISGSKVISGSQPSSQTLARGNAAVPSSAEAHQATIPSKPAPSRTSLLADDVTSEILRCITELAIAGQQITEANAVVRIQNTVRDQGVKTWLSQNNFSMSFFTASGDASAINVELMAWTLGDDPNAFVVPHPQAGRVGQFNKWFDFKTADYSTQPVLADFPARGRLEAGRLLPVSFGILRAGHD